MCTQTSVGLLKKSSETYLVGPLSEAQLYFATEFCLNCRWTQHCLAPNRILNESENGKKEK